MATRGERTYRKNVGMIVINNEKKFLICQRADNNHWQFPQGGVDNGETHIDALFRELNEEIGTVHVKVIASTDHLYTYDWPPHIMARDNFKGQSQRYYLLKFTGEDADIRIDQREFQSWQWINKEDLIKTVEPVRLPIYKKVLEEFEKELNNI